MVRLAFACSLVCLVACVDATSVIDESLTLDRVELDREELAARRADWLGWAPRCSGAPSKEGCDDGDTTLFNGLLCASGEALGCDAVRLAQSDDGRFWRSPRRAPGNLGQPRSFSRDMTMGVLLYLATTRDRGAAQRWLAWIDDNRPCAIERPWGGCLVRGLHRVCRDDVNGTCTVTPGLWALMGKVWDHLGLARHAEMIRWAAFDTDLAALEATFTEPGYQLHLKGVAIFLKEVLGVQRTWRLETARMIGERQPANPFFRYLWDGPSDQVAAEVLARCPALGAPPANHSQWAWERADDSEAWRESMGWDCVFLGNLLLR